MSRLPVPGSDDNTWGDILNDFLGVVHNTDGSIKTGAIGSSQIADGSITTTDISATAGIVRTQLSTGVQASLASADSALQTVPNATSTTAGAVRLSGDLGGTAASPTVPTKVSKTGDTMSGNLTVSRDAPRITASNTGLTQYNNAGLQLLNAAAGMGNQAGTLLLSGINDANTSQGYFAIAKADLNGANASNIMFVDYNANTTTLSSALLMSSQKISNVAAPTSPSDAATKSYVDIATTGAEQTANKGQANGYAGLDASGGLNITNRVARVGPVNYSYTASLAGGGANSGYLIIDKANTASDGSVIFRDQGSIKAEIGLQTDNDIHFKTVAGAPGSEVFTDRFLLKANGNSWFPGKLGVGTEPVEQMHIATSNTSGRPVIKIENDAASGSNSAGLTISGRATNWTVGTDAGLNGGNNFFVQDNNAGYPPRLFIDGSGNIAIGKDSATAKLDVSGTAAFSGQVTASAGITMASSKIANLADPTAQQDAATKAYVDANAGGAGTVHLTGAETISGVKTFTASPVVPVPVNTTDAANKSYVDSATSGAVTQSQLNSYTVDPSTIGVPIVGINGVTVTETTSQITIGYNSPGSSAISRSISQVAAVTTAAGAANTDYVYYWSGSALYTLTMPTAVSNTNRYTLKNASSVSQSVTTSASQTIEGGASITITAGNSVDLISNGSNWMVI